MGLSSWRAKQILTKTKFIQGHLTDALTLLTLYALNLKDSENKKELLENAINSLIFSLAPEHFWNSQIKQKIKNLVEVLLKSNATPLKELAGVIIGDPDKLSFEMFHLIAQHNLSSLYQEDETQSKRITKKWKSLAELLPLATFNAQAAYLRGPDFMNLTFYGVILLLVLGSMLITPGIFLLPYSSASIPLIIFGGICLLFFLNNLMTITERSISSRNTLEKELATEIPPVTTEDPMFLLVTKGMSQINSDLKNQSSALAMTIAETPTKQRFSFARFFGSGQNKPSKPTINCLQSTNYQDACLSSTI